MRFIAAAIAVVASAGILPIAVAGQGSGSPSPIVVLDNARVQVLKATGVGALANEHGSGVVISLDDSTRLKSGDAVWADDIAKSTGDVNSIIVVVPKAAPAPAAPPSASKPGDAPFKGMSFKTLVDNNHVTIIRARMERGAEEAFHTHASDTVVVHLSGGSIEDTADGQTKVNRWNHGDVEFEARGSSHSARNVGEAVDVVLVALK